MLNIFADALILATRLHPLPSAPRTARPEHRDEILDSLQDRPRSRRIGLNLLGL